MQSLTTQRLESMRMEQDPLLINVLDAEYFDQARIPGSVNIPLSQDEFVDAVEREAGSTGTAVVVYCAGPDCAASSKAARMLADAGFETVYHYGGGMKEWAAAGNPIERGTPVPAA